MMINIIKFYLISPVVPLLFLITSFNNDGFSLVNDDVPQDLEYGINFNYHKNWKLLPEFEIDTNNHDLSTTSYTLAEKILYTSTKVKHSMDILYQ